MFYLFLLRIALIYIKYYVFTNDGIIYFLVVLALLETDDYFLHYLKVKFYNYLFNLYNYVMILFRIFDVSGDNSTLYKEDK